MAGSYNHIITEDGNLASNKRFAGMIENLGDAYEMTEEMYGMIWCLAALASRIPGTLPMEELVEYARTNYKTGLSIAKQNPNKKKNNGR